MSESIVRGNIEDVLNGISEIGNVYDYQRYVTDWSDFLDLFKVTIAGSQTIRGWTISCEEIAQEYGQFGKLWRTYTYRIRGYFALVDGSETEISTMAKVEEVMEALDADPDLHSTASTGLVNDFPSNLDVFEARAFGSALCHYIEIVQVVIEEV